MGSLNSAPRMRSSINSRAKSALPAMMVASMRPCGVDTSKANKGNT